MNSQGLCKSLLSNGLTPFAIQLRRRPFLENCFGFTIPGMTGVAALGQRHVEESQREKEFVAELKGLKHSKLGRQSSLANLQREARAHTNSFKDIQVMYRQFLLYICCSSNAALMRFYMLAVLTCLVLQIFLA